MLRKVAMKVKMLWRLKNELDKEENYVDERLHNNELTIKHISCFAHTLQLCVSDGIKGCRRLQNLLAKAGKIVAHVRKSTIVIEKLEEEFRKVLIAKKLFLDLGFPT